MKKETRAQKYNDYADVIKALQEGRHPKRSSRRDRSIATHPVVPVQQNLHEKYVLIKCMSWLRKQRLVCNRNNVGRGRMGPSGIYAYGIKDAGDIIGLLRNGRHFEVEAKRSSGGRLSYGQQQRMRKVTESNGLYFVVHGAAELAYFMEQYL